MSNITIEPLDPYEREYLIEHRGGSLVIMGIFAALVSIPTSCAYITHPPPDPPFLFWSLAAFVAAMCAALFLWIKWIEFGYFRDLRRNRKVVIYTTIERLHEVYFRGSSSYELYIPDERPAVRRRRFAIDKDAFGLLKRGEPVRISFLPVSGRVLAIDAASYRYRLGDD